LILSQKFCPHFGGLCVYTYSQRSLLKKLFSPIRRFRTECSLSPNLHVTKIRCIMFFKVHVNLAADLCEVKWSGMVQPQCENHIIKARVRCDYPTKQPFLIPCLPEALRFKNSTLKSLNKCVYPL